MILFLRIVLIALTVPLSWSGLEAQGADTTGLPSATVPPSTTVRPYATVPLVSIGGSHDEWLRTAQLFGQRESAGYLLRSTSSISEALEIPEGARVSILAPELRIFSNSALPFSQNLGAAWAGRGITMDLMGGVRLDFPGVSVVLAPHVTYTENRDFPLLPDSLFDRRPDRSAFVAPWYLEDTSIDLPLRFGEGSYALFDPGQSSITLRAGPVAFGAATENQWWGPGIRNSIVMSNHAAGIPHLFLRTRAPIRTMIGAFEGRWVVGGLTESLFFDTVSTNDLRSLSGAVVTFTPAFEPGLTLGVARTVYAAASGAMDVLGAAPDVFTRWETRGDANLIEWMPASQQLISFFGRWLHPESGFEAYGEWARHELPLSGRDLLAAPHHSQGYTVGLQWARPLGESALRLQGELTHLEQSSTFKHRPFETFYTSQSIPQGYTQRGQSLGAAIGPGSSSQWVAADYLAGTWSAGLFANRIRWETDAIYRSRSPNPFRTFRSFHARDVSAIAGARAGVRLGRLQLDAEYGLEQRVNFLFQNPDSGFSSEGAVDVRNHQLRLRVSPAISRRLPHVARRAAPPHTSPE
jgi:hypothetical protein